MNIDTSISLICDNTTVSQPDIVTTQQCHNTTMSQHNSVTTQQCRNTRVSQHKSVTTQQYHNTTMSQHINVTTQQSQHNVTIQQCHNTTISQPNSVTTQQCLNTTVSQHKCHNTTMSQHKCHNSKFVIFQEKPLKVLKCYNFLWVQRRHNCSPAASFANCVMTLKLLKVHLQTFLSTSVTQKRKNFLSCDPLFTNEPYVNRRWWYFNKELWSCLLPIAHLYVMWGEIKKIYIYI